MPTLLPRYYSLLSRRTLHFALRVRFVRSRNPEIVYISCRPVSPSASPSLFSSISHLDVNMSETNRPGWNKPLDESLYAPDEDEKAFMKATTGIHDDGELKRHIIAVQHNAFAVRRALVGKRSLANERRLTAVQISVHPTFRGHEVRA